MQNESLIIGTVKLPKPIEAHGEMIGELNFPEPLAEHLMAMDEAKGDMGKSIALIASLAKIPPSAAKKLPASIVKKSMELLAPFLLDSQEIGEMSMDV